MHHTATKNNAQDAPETSGQTIRWWAPAYDAVTWLATFGQEPAIRRQTLKAAGLRPGEKVLDVGCGTGTLSIAAGRRVRPDGEVTGIDASPEMIALARRKAARKGSAAGFQVAPVETLPFADESYDVVLSSLMLHHLPDDVKEKGMAEVFRVLKPGGRFVAVDLTAAGTSFASRVIRLIGHKMPRDYAARLISGMQTAGFTEVAEKKTRFGYLAFITATKGQ